MLLNLLRHAVQHGRAQSTVVSTLDRAGRCALLTIHNDGPLLPHGNAAAAPDPLSAGTEAPLPRGLGLFIAREIVRRHQGRLSVSADAGDGTRFSLLLPLAQG
ncbi:ATP-binding protein [Tahibacter harae]|uniref:ATP-binding protein n=1 Tax=Tahibacter harae TaxID=2963937 RepID=UPI0034E074DB